MTILDGWLKQATRCLSQDSTAQVRREIGEHYEAAREAAMTGGAPAEEAEVTAMAALGEARAANRQYRKVLLTAAEARVLRNGNWEARAICSRPWLRRVLVGLSVIPVVAFPVAWLAGAPMAAWVSLAAAMVTVQVLAASYLRLATPARARVFRWVKWTVFAGAVVMAFGPDAQKWWWLPISCLWPAAWTEWTRASIRRKLPVGQWPKNLYL